MPPTPPRTRGFAPSIPRRTKQACCLDVRHLSCDRKPQLNRACLPTTGSHASDLMRLPQSQARATHIETPRSKGEPPCNRKIVCRAPLSRPSSSHRARHTIAITSAYSPRPILAVPALRQQRRGIPTPSSPEYLTAQCLSASESHTQSR